MLSIVVPAYNEEKRLPGTLASMCAWLDGRGERYEIVVADDGSRDATADLARAAGPHVRVVSLGVNRGKGAAVRAGVLATVGDEVLFADADDATPIEELLKLRAHLTNGADIAIGSRATGADIRVRQTAIRQGMGKTFNRIVRVLVLSGIEDTQCGFKLFKGDIARELFAQATIDGFAFDVEILLLAKARYKIAEVPIVWRHVEESKVSPGIDAARMLVDVVKLRVKWIRKSWNRRKP